MSNSPVSLIGLKEASADPPSAVPKGSPAVVRGGAFDFAALLSAGVAAVHDEQPPAIDGAASSLGRPAAATSGAPGGLQGRGQRRGDDRGRTLPQAAAAPTTPILVPTEMPAGWLRAASLQTEAVSKDGKAQSDRFRATPAGTEPFPSNAGAVVPAPLGLSPGPASAQMSAAPRAGANDAGTPATTTPRALAGGLTSGDDQAATAAPPVTSALPAATRTAESATPSTSASLSAAPFLAATSQTSTPYASASAVSATHSSAASAQAATPPTATSSSATAIGDAGAGPQTPPTGVPVTAAVQASVATVAPAVRRTQSTSQTPANTATRRDVSFEPSSARTVAGAGPSSDSALSIPAQSSFASAPSPNADGAPEPPVVVSVSVPQGGVATVDAAAIDANLVAAVAHATPVSEGVGAVALGRSAEVREQRRAGGVDVGVSVPLPAVTAPKSQGRGASPDTVVRSQDQTGLKASSTAQPVVPSARDIALPANAAAAARTSARIEDSPSTPAAAVRSKIDGAVPASPDLGPQPSVTPQTAVQVAPVLAADPAKNVTAVTKASPAPTGPSPAVGEKLRDVIASVANHAVLRGEATGQIDVPELGRITVRAHTAAGTVDVAVTADGQAARDMLRGHVVAMTADLHAADLPLGRLTVDHAGASFGDALGSSMSSPDRGGSTGRDPARDNRPPSDAEGVPAVVDAVAPRRVRIVL